MRVSSGKQQLPVSSLALFSTWDQGGLGCLLLPVHRSFAVVARAGNELKKGVSFREKSDGAKKCFV